MSTVLEKAVLLDETGQLIVDKLDDIKEAISTTGDFYPLAIKVTTPPSKNAYFIGETLDLTGIVVKLMGSTGAEIDVTTACTFNPANGAVLTSQDTSIEITYHWYKDNIDFTTTQAIESVNINSITITTPPTKVNYYKGEQLDLSGIVVQGITDGNTQVDVTSLCTFSPADGTTLTTLGTVVVTASLTAAGQTYTDSTNIGVELKLVSWSTGTDSEIKDMIDNYYSGDLTLAEIQSVWSIGDEREVTLSAMAATGVGESHVEQAVKFVLMNWGGKNLEDNSSCLAIVGQKDCLAEKGYMHHEATTGINWYACDRRTWCNSVYRNAIPQTFRDLFKQFKNKSQIAGSTSLIDSTDYFTLPAVHEVKGASASQASSAEGSQFEYYTTAANQTKKKSDGSTEDASYWFRSGYTSDAKQFWVYWTSSLYQYQCNNSNPFIAPYGCI